MNEAKREMTRLDLWLRCSLYFCAALALLSVTLCVPYVAWKAARALDSIAATAAEAQKPIANADGLILEAKQAAGRFNDAERVKRVDDYLISQSAAALATTNNSRKIANNLNEAIKQDLRPLLQDLRPRLNAQIEELTATTAELRTQIKQNGEGARALLDEGKVLIADSHVQVVDLLKELNKTADGLSVITNDPDLAATIENLNKTSFNLAGTTGHIEVISSDMEGMSAKYLRPLYQPKQRGFFGKLGSGALTVFRYATGASNIVYLIGRF